MIRDVDAIILYVQDLPKMVAFYRAMGLSLEMQEDVLGERHYACEMGLSHFAIFAAREGEADNRYRSGGSTVIGFQVDKLDQLLRTAQAAGAQIIEESQEVPWGRRALIADPEGRFVELNQPRVTGQFTSFPTGTI